MKLDFRIEWGYQILYSRRHYHPQYIWDGHLDCEKGRLESLSLYHCPRCISGPVNCPQETPLPGNSWRETTRRALSGLHVKAEVEPDAVFHLVTATIRITNRSRHPWRKCSTWIDYALRYFETLPLRQQGPEFCQTAARRSTPNSLFELQHGLF